MVKILEAGMPKTVISGLIEGTPIVVKNFIVTNEYSDFGEMFYEATCVADTVASNIMISSPYSSVKLSSAEICITSIKMKLEYGENIELNHRVLEDAIYNINFKMVVNPIQLRNRKNEFTAKISYDDMDSMDYELKEITFEFINQVDVDYIYDAIDGNIGD